MNILIALILTALVSAGGSSWVTATYYRAEAAELLAEDIGEKFSSVNQRIDEFNSEVKLINLSEKKARDELHQNQIQFTDSLRLIGRVHADVGQLRGQYATLDKRLQAAAPGDAKLYAQTCHKLLTSMGELGAEMAAAGAELARNADGHSIDAERQAARPASQGGGQ